jgi:WD40 repeat protein
MINIDNNNNTKEIDIIIEFELDLDKKLYSSFYKMTLLNEGIFALLYNSGSFDLFFIQKDQESKKLKLIRKKYINHENSTNIINQILLAKEENHIIVLIKDKINFYKYDENEIIYFVKQIDRNNITLMKFLTFHNSILSLFNTYEIIIKDELVKNNYIINIKEKQVNIIYEIKSFNYLAITHFDSDIDIFDLDLMILKNKLKGHKKIVNDLKELIPIENSNYNPKLLSCSDDSTIRIWDLVYFYCENIINLENYSFLFYINIMSKNEIIALDNENILHIIE